MRQAVTYSILVILFFFQTTNTTGQSSIKTNTKDNPVIYVIDLDQTPTGQDLVAIIQSLLPEAQIEYATSVFSYPLSGDVEIVFILLGIWPNNSVLTEPEALIITDWLINNPHRNIYMEGGDTWEYDTTTSLHPYFNIDPIIDGIDDLANVTGISSFWLNDSWIYTGENNWIDRIEAIPPAINIMKNTDEGYYTAVAYSDGSYNTIGASHEIMGLTGGAGTLKAVLNVLSWFDYQATTLGSIEGYVAENFSGYPIDSAYINLGGISDTYTDNNGYFSIEGTVVGEWDITAVKENYQPQSFTVTILQDSLIFQDFQLIAPGSLNGIVSENSTGNPIEGAIIVIGDSLYYTTSASDGSFNFDEVITGDHTVSCKKTGYSTIMENITVYESTITEINFDLIQPEFFVIPDTLFLELEPNSIGMDTIFLTNQSNANVTWNTSINYFNYSDDLFDLIWEQPVGVGGGEAGIETNGNYIYTTKWNGIADFYRYDMSGNYIETIVISGAPAIRDMAYDGNYFYGGQASSTVFELDLDNATLVSTFTAPTECRAIAYNEDDEIFYANNWGSDITLFDKSGSFLGSFAVGPVGDSYYGLAYDGFLEGGPYLWGYAQVGNSLNELIQIALPDGIETGLTFDVGSVLSASDLAGGLAIDNNIQQGQLAFLGMSQNVTLWAMGIVDCCGWVSLSPTTDTLLANSSAEIYVTLETMGMLPGDYHANIVFTTDPNVANPIVDVIVNVIGLVPAIDLTASFECTDVLLQWEIPPGNNPTGWNIYKNGEFLTYVTEMEYSDDLALPEVEHSYYVTAVYPEGESNPCEEITISFPVPQNLEPLNLYVHENHPYYNYHTFYWDSPNACLQPDGYNIYRNGIKINGLPITGNTYIDVTSPGFYEYFFTAVYYFGESEYSNPAWVLYYGEEELYINQINAYPNPTNSVIAIRAHEPIHSIEVRNSMGEIILQLQPNQNDFSIDLSEQPNGVYFIAIELEGNTISERILKI